MRYNALRRGIEAGGNRHRKGTFVKSKTEKLSAAEGRKKWCTGWVGFPGGWQKKREVSRSGTSRYTGETRRRGIKKTGVGQ